MAFKLKLKGFQSHENTELDIRGNFVCITGPNNIGKSAIIRAVRWLFYDALRGSRFIRQGQNTASVDMEFDGCRVARVKGAGRNAYDLNGASLESINKGTPPEVMSALNIHPVIVDKDVEIELNVVRQAEHPFLVGVPSSAKAKALNVLTGHHVLDVAIRETATIIRRFKTEDSELKERIDRVTIDLKSFDDLPEKMVILDQAKTVLGRVEAITGRVTDGRRLNGLRQAVQGTLDRLMTRPTVDIKAVDIKMASLDDAVGRKQALFGLKGRLIVSRSTVSGLSNRPTIDLMSLDALLDRLGKLEDKRTLLKRRALAVAEVDQHKNTLEFTRIQLDRAKSQLKMLAGSTCVTCGQALSAECLEVA